MIQGSGVDIWYIPLENFELDPILKEPKKVVFDRAYQIEAYIPDGGNFEGEQNIMSKLGFRVRQTTELIISRKRFRELGTDRPRPKEGDLIYIGDPENPDGSFTNTMFQINGVWHVEPDWQFGKHMAYRIVCEIWTGAYDKFETGIPAIDQANAVNELEMALGLNDEVEEATQTLAVFDKTNPFMDF